MSVNKEERNEIIQFILLNIRAYPENIAKVTQEKFSLSRTAILHYIKQLIDEKKIAVEGTTKNRKYTLLPITNFQTSYPIDSEITEDKVWRADIAPLLKNERQNVFEICQYGFTEIFNNAVETF